MRISYQLHSLFNILRVPVPEFIDPVFASPKRSFSVTENRHFGLVFVKTGSINSGTAQLEYSARIYRPCFRENKPKTGSINSGTVLFVNSIHTAQCTNSIHAATYVGTYFLATATEEEHQGYFHISVSTQPPYLHV